MRASSIERRSLSMSCFGRELWKLHNSAMNQKEKRGVVRRASGNWFRRVHARVLKSGWVGDM